MMCRIMGAAANQRGRSIALGFVLTGLFLTCPPPAVALDPALDVSQYAHTAWKFRDGFTKGEIFSIAQTPDGYLWLGTEFGLLRFDGKRTVSWQPPQGQSLPSKDVRALLSARDGTLWIGTRKGLASWKDGKLTHYSGLKELIILRLLEDRQGTVWAGAYGVPAGRLCSVQKDGVQCYGEDGQFGPGVIGLFEDSKGNLWAGVRDGLWRWKPGPPKLYPMPGESNGISGMTEDSDGALLVGWKGAIYRVSDEQIEAYAVPGAVHGFRTQSLLRDRDGGLWIGTRDRGLLHVHQGRTDVFSLPDGLSGELADSFLEDREGNVWVTTIGGLDCFRELAVATLSVKQGLSHALVGSVLAAKDGAVWLGTSGGLNRWFNGEISAFGKQGGKFNGHNPSSLFQDSRGRIWVSTFNDFGYLENDRFVSINGLPSGNVHGLGEDSDRNLWIANKESGLFRLSPRKEIQKFPWSALKAGDYAEALIADSLHGGVWLGFSSGGVAYFADGQVRRSYTAADGLGDGWVANLRLDSDGTLWAATEGGLSRLTNGRITTLTSKNGLPCDTVHWSMEDDTHWLWLYMACGLVRIAKPELDTWIAAVDKDKNSNRTIQATVFDISDGVIIHGPGGYAPLVAKSADGRLWFLPFDGVSIVDPRHIPFNKIPPPVHIEQITADRKVYDTSTEATGHLRLPPLIRDLQIDYTALSLVAPEKVLFRYKLEGRDSDWQEAGNRRQAFYTNLRPGNYRFRVAACNNSGVWNEAGATLDFSIAPAYYQTRWFQLLCLFAAILVGWALYRLRVRRLANAMSARFDERLAERTRVARELHDTLLQTVQGSKFLVDGVLMDPSKDPVRMRGAMEKLSDSLRLATQEARDALNALRASTVQKNDLAEALQQAIEDCRKESCIETSLHLSGDAKDMHPVAREEVYRIGYEGVRNACAHSQAKRLEVSLNYGRDLTLRVSDNGIGMDPVVADKGKDGHFGLHGMRERAARIGGKLTMVSSVGSGTKITLVVPGNHIFRKPGASLLEKLREIIKGPDPSSPN